MEEFKKMPPFSVYDFFGYLFPASILTGIGALSLFVSHPSLAQKIKPILLEVDTFVLGSFQVPVVIFFIVFCIAVLYFVGHAIGTLSHLIFDRIIVKNIFGYPMETLLGRMPTRKRTVEATYFYIVAVILCYLLLVPLDRFLNHGWGQAVLQYGTRWSWLIILVTSLIVFTLNKAYYDEVAKWERNSFKIKVFDFFSNLYFAPYRIAQRIMIFPLASLFSCVDKMPDVTIKKFQSTIQCEMGISESEYLSLGTEVYWLPVFKMHSQRSAWSEKIENWMNLYGFMRNLSMAGIIICIEIALILSSNFSNRFGSASNKALLTAIYYSILLASILLGIRFWVFYRNYYSKNIIRGYCYESAKRDIESRQD